MWYATFLIRLNGLCILTDPFLSKNAGPGFLGPKRQADCPLELNQLTRIHVIVINHNHYDHLDSKVIKNFPNKQKIKVIIPLGLKKFFLKRGFIKVIEMSWW